jgi:hypothetical protein
VEGLGWRAIVARYRTYDEQPERLYPTRDLAIAAAERWARANLAAIVDELPKLYRTQCGVMSTAAPAVAHSTTAGTCSTV